MHCGTTVSSDNGIDLVRRWFGFDFWQENVFYTITNPSNIN